MYFVLKIKTPDQIERMREACRVSYVCNYPFSYIIFLMHANIASLSHPWSSLKHASLLTIYMYRRTVCCMHPRRRILHNDLSLHYC